MTERFAIAIVGGGIVGISTAWHLANAGQTDVVLLERTELTAGSTWHAAGNLPHFAGSPVLMRLMAYTKMLYRDLETRHGDIGLHLTGSLRLARTPERMDEYRRAVGLGRAAGIPLELMTPEAAHDRWPVFETHDLLGVLWDPNDGHVDPTSVANAMARDAREAGVRIKRNTPVTAVRRENGQGWVLTVPDGEVRAATVVNAAGFRAREVAVMMGHDLPIANMEHQYLVTEPIPTLEARDGEIPMIRDPEPRASYYLRQERGGVIIGPYEHDGRLWAVDGVPEEFGQELLEPDLERIESHLVEALERVPLAAEAGIRTVVNGPIAYTPDGPPLVGPVPGVPGAFVAGGTSFGIAQGPGMGRACAEYILDGAPWIDAWEIDPRRFGPYATPGWVAARAKDVYDNEYALSAPHEHAMRNVARGARTTPATALHVAADAAMTTAFGWERPAWFGANGPEMHGFRRRSDPRAFAAIAEECRAVRERVGLLDLSAFSKFDVTGAEAIDAIDRLGANRAPRKDGGIVLTHALTPSGGVAAEFSVTRFGPEHFYCVSAAAAELHDRDLLGEAAEGLDAAVGNITTDHGCFVLAGPRARDVLATLTDADLGNAAFPWLTAREITVAGVPLRALRVNFVGELGWELHHRIENQLVLYDALTEAGAAHGLRPFGLRAMDSLRLEKAYRGWRVDLITERSPLEAGMNRFLRLDDNRGFRGREAVVAQARDGVPARLVLLDVEAGDADAIAGEPVTAIGSDTPVGVVTSGGYAHTAGKSLALAYVDGPHAVEGATLAVEILGEVRSAGVTFRAVHDPDNARLRA